MHPMPLVLLLIVGGSVHACSASKKSEPIKAVGETPVGEPVPRNEPTQSSPDDSFAKALGEESIGLKGTDAEKVLADPGGTPSSGAMSAIEMDQELDEAIARAKGAKEHRDATDLKESIAMLEKALQDDPNKGPAFMELARAHSGLGHAGAARAALERAIESAGDTEEEWLAEAYRLLGYAIREDNGDRKAQLKAWQNYLDRMEEDTAATREVRILILPLRDR